MDKRFVTREEAVPARQQIAFQPALALMLGEHFHRAAIVRFAGAIIRINLSDEASPRRIEHVLPAVRRQLVGAEHAEVFRFVIEFHHVAQKLPLNARRLDINRTRRWYVY